MNAKRAMAMALCIASLGMAGISRGGVSPEQNAAGLKAALEQAATVAVASLGKTDGFMGNPEVRIALPGKLQKAGKKLHKLGFGKQTDELTLAMNRAAEAALPEATALFADAISHMTVTDALGILNGPDDAATRFFEQSMSEKLAAKFLPVVSKATASVELAQHYNDVAAKASALGLVDQRDTSLDAYVTRKALDGLFLTMAKEEAAIRHDPVGQANALLRSVFGAVEHK